jgi:hypothetical protein
VADQAVLDVISEIALVGRFELPVGQGGVRLGGVGALG